MRRRAALPGRRTSSMIVLPPSIRLSPSFALACYCLDRQREAEHGGGMDAILLGLGKVIADAVAVVVLDSGRLAKVRHGLQTSYPFRNGRVGYLGLSILLS